MRQRRTSPRNPLDICRVRLSRVGPEHAYLKDIGRVNYVTINDEEALYAFRMLTTTEGIIPALESSHAIAYAINLAKNSNSRANIIVNLSGRGDKDIHTVAQIDGIAID